MNTDIRLLVPGLRPMADFQSHVNRTIDALNLRIEDMIAVDEEDERELEELRDLSDFWSDILTAINEKV